MNKLKIFNFLLEATENSDIDTVDDLSSSAYGTFFGIINTIFPIFIGFVLVLAIFFGITLGIRYARSDDDESKKKVVSNIKRLRWRCGCCNCLCCNHPSNFELCCRFTT